jgi:hypothetical protein
MNEHLIPAVEPLRLKGKPHTRLRRVSTRQTGPGTGMSSRTLTLLNRPLPNREKHRYTSPPEPSGARYSARVAISCMKDCPPGQVLHGLQELRSNIDDRLGSDLGRRYDRHNAQSAGADKLTVTFILRGDTHADAIRSAGLAAGTLAELLTENGAAVDLSGLVLIVRAQ